MQRDRRLHCISLRDALTRSTPPSPAPARGRPDTHFALAHSTRTMHRAHGDGMVDRSRYVPIQCIQRIGSARASHALHPARRGARLRGDRRDQDRLRIVRDHGPRQLSVAPVAAAVLQLCPAAVGTAEHAGATLNCVRSHTRRPAARAHLALANDSLVGCSAQLRTQRKCHASPERTVRLSGARSRYVASQRKRADTCEENIRSRIVILHTPGRRDKRRHRGSAHCRLGVDAAANLRISRRCTPRHCHSIDVHITINNAGGRGHGNGIKLCHGRKRRSRHVRIRKHR